MLSAYYSVCLFELGYRNWAIFSVAFGHVVLSKMLLQECKRFLDDRTVFAIDLLDESFGNDIKSFRSVFDAINQVVSVFLLEALIEG